MALYIAIFTNLYIDNPYFSFKLSSAITNDSLINKVCFKEISFFSFKYTFIFSVLTNSSIEALINLFTDASYLSLKFFLNFHITYDPFLSFF